MPRARVLFPKGLFYQQSRLPAEWATLSTKEGTLDVFLLSNDSMHYDDVVTFHPISFCRIRDQEGLICDLIVGVDVAVQASRKNIKIFESQIAKFIHAHWEILSWGNKQETLQLLKKKYNITS